MDIIKLKIFLIQIYRLKLVEMSKEKIYIYIYMLVFTCHFFLFSNIKNKFYTNKFIFLKKKKKKYV